MGRKMETGYCRQGPDWPTTWPSRYQEWIRKGGIGVCAMYMYMYSCSEGSEGSRQMSKSKSKYDIPYLDWRVTRGSIRPRRKASGLTIVIDLVLVLI